MNSMTPEQLTNALTILQAICHRNSVIAGWWHDDQDIVLNPSDPYVRGAKLALIHSKISEALEGERTGLPDDKLAHRPATEVELADAMIRIFDYAGACGYDLAGALFEKLEYNKIRPDHKLQARASVGGKKF